LNLRESFNLFFNIKDIKDEDVADGKYEVMYGKVDDWDNFPWDGPVGLESVMLTPEMKGIDGYAILIVESAAKDMTDTYAFILKYDGKIIFTNKDNVNSVQTYCQTMKAADPNNGRLVRLCDAILDYGSSAQQHFYRQTGGDLANGGTYQENINDPIGDNFKSYVRVLKGDTIYKGFSTALDTLSKTGLQVTITFTKQLIPDIKVIKNGSALTEDEDYTITKVNNTKYRVYIKNIKALDLSSDYKIVVTSGDDSFEYEYSALAYACKWQEYNTAPYEFLGLMCRAIYRFWDAAEQYV
jgi:hypothetical protein